MIEHSELVVRINEVDKIRPWYQSVPYGDIVSPNSHFENRDVDKKFYGDGRWFHYIEPMICSVRDLDTMNSSFCEVGCSAGLFLLRAWQRFGFCRLLGIEAAQGAFQQLLITKDYYDEMPLVVYNVAVGQMEPNIANDVAKPIDVGTFPIVDVTLLSCVHYHLRECDFKWYVGKLAHKSFYLFILTNECTHDVMTGESVYTRNCVLATRCWELISEHKTSGKHSGSHMNLTGLIFRSKILKRFPVDECFEVQVAASKANKDFYWNVFPDFIAAVLAGETTKSNYVDSEVYKWQKEGRYESTAWTSIESAARTLSYVSMVHTIKDHGQEQPIILLKGDNWDGHHRVAVLKHFGMKYVYGVNK